MSKEQKKEHKTALSDINGTLGPSPKNITRGVSAGIGNILGGAVGGIGVLIITPVAMGVKCSKGKMGVFGGVLGVTGGIAVGAIGMAFTMVAGVGVGLWTMVKGVVAEPKAIMGPMSGKWWDETTGKWVETNLVSEAVNLSKLPDDDKDILGKAIAAAEGPTEVKDADLNKSVKETYYYDKLEVDPSADQKKIKRQYYILARQNHPDRVGPDNKEAMEKFKDISEAYQVLSDETLREKYNEEGREGLSGDRTTTIDEMQKIDPALLFAFLFGSDRLNEYLGRLAMATSAIVGDSQEISVEECIKLQKRRCVRLAIKLAERVNGWVEAGNDTELESAEAKWKIEAQDLSTASYGPELIHLIGQVYSLAAAQYLGSLDSGIGMPGIGKWASKNGVFFKRKSNNRKLTIGAMKDGLALSKLDNEKEEILNSAATEEEIKEITKQYQAKSVEFYLKMMWTVTAVDVAATLHETCQMMLFDKSKNTFDESIPKKEQKALRKKRGQALERLGEIFTTIPVAESEIKKNSTELYEEAAVAAMLETVKRKEEENFHASIKQ